jgi:3-deoxy-manno-octulosonate cytidylyltransferase (CMP-KDO synthetase)
MKTIALIPARYNSTRLPGKLMLDLNGKTVIRRTYEAVIATQLFEKVYVVTDSNIIYDEIQSFGGFVVMSDNHFECGTDRIASVLPLVEEADIYINVQGDEPFTTSEPLQQLIDAFVADKEQLIGVCTLRQHIEDDAIIKNPNVVKVITRADNSAIYFSRSPIPYNRDNTSQVPYYKHIGIYAFRKQALIDFAQLPIGILEQTEKLENLRFVENNILIKALETSYINIGIDTEEDLVKAREMMTR